MKKIYRHAETGFEKISTLTTTAPGNSITFMLALGMVVFWLFNKEFYMQDTPGTASGTSFTGSHF